MSGSAVMLMFLLAWLAHQGENGIRGLNISILHSGSVVDD